MFTGYSDLSLRHTNATQLPNMERDLKGFKSIDLVHSNISDISFLRRATDLLDIDLSHTPVKDISILAELPYLNSIRLEGCPVSDISALRENLILTDVDLNGTQVTDISALRELIYLETVDLSNTRVEDLSPLFDLGQLRELNLVGVPPIKDVSPILAMKSLGKLRLPVGTKFDEADSEKARELDEVYIGEDRAFSRRE